MVTRPDGGELQEVADLLARRVVVAKTARAHAWKEAREDRSLGREDVALAELVFAA